MFRQESLASSHVSRDDFETQLGRAITQRIDQGIKGIPKFNPANPAKPEYGDVVTRSYWMEDKVRLMANEIAQRDKTLCPHQFAAWMMCTSTSPSQYGTRILFPTGFRMAMARERLGHYLDKHFKGKVIYSVDSGLYKRMCG